MDLLVKLLSMFDRKEKRRLCFLVFFLVSAAILETLSVAFFVPFVGLITDPKIIERNKLLGRLHHLTGDKPYPDFLIACGLLLVMMYIVKNLFIMYSTHYQNRLVFEKHEKLCRDLLQAYLKQPFAFHLKNNSALLLRNLSEISTIFHGVIIPLLTVIAEGLVIFALGLMLFIMQPLVTLVAMGSLGLLTFGFYSQIRRKLREQGQKQQEYSGQMIKWVNQALGGIKETKILGCEDFFLNAYTKNVHGYAEATRYSQTVGQLPKLFIETIAIIGLVLVICVGVWKNGGGTSLLPVLGLFALATVRLMPSITRIVSNMSVMRFCRPSVDVVHDGLSLIAEALTPLRRLGQTSKKSFSKTIEIDRLKFSYPESGRIALDEISLAITKGESIALVGPSGAGKTTVVDLILGLLEPTSGTIKVDGISIFEDLQFWRSRIGYIPQVIYLSDDTIRRNVAFGIPDEEIDEGRVWASLKAAQLDDFILSLHEKLETWVGERGVRISGGQRQRIGIARALYREPDVLILDEATSSLDHETEAEVTKAIEGLIGVKTLIVIAHRLTTAKKCKKIYKIAAGKIVSQGSFQDVIASETPI